MIENELEHNEEPKVRALVEERGGVVLDHLSKVDSEHVIRYIGCQSRQGCFCY